MARDNRVRLPAAERERLSEIIAYQQSFTLCRTFGHAWASFEGNSVDGNIPLLLRCDRCGTERFDEISANSGALVGRTYTYPDGYRELESGRQTKDDWRMAFLVKAGFVR